MIRYIFNRFKLSYDDEFSNIENILIETISKDWTKIIKNIYNIYNEDLLIFATDSNSNENKSIEQIQQNMSEQYVSTNNGSGTASGTASGNASGTASGIAHGNIYGNASGIAQGNASGTASDNEFLRNTSINGNKSNSTLVQTGGSGPAGQEESSLGGMVRLESNSNKDRSVPANVARNNISADSSVVSNNGRDPVPAPRVNKNSLMEVKDKSELSDLKLFPHFFGIFSKNIIREKFKEHEVLSSKYYFMIFFIIISFILICWLQLNFVSFTDNANLKNIISFMCVMTVYVPLIIIFIVMTYYITDKLWVKRLNLIIGYIGIFISLFISTGTVPDSSKNIPFWFVFCLLLIMSFINIGCRLFGKYTPLEDIDKIGGFEPKPPEVVLKSDVLDIVDDLQKQIQSLEEMVELNRKNSNNGTVNNGRVNKNKYIQSLYDMMELITQISNSAVLQGNITYRQKFIDLLIGLRNSGTFPNLRNELTNMKSASNISIAQLNSIQNIFVRGVQAILNKLQIQI